MEIRLAGKRVLCMRAGALGDTLVTLPSLAALRGAVGTYGSVAFAGRMPSAGLTVGPRHASAVLSVDAVPLRHLFAPSHPPSRTTTDALDRLLGGFDLVVAWMRAPRLADRLADLEIPFVFAEPLPPEGVHASDHFMGSLDGVVVAGEFVPISPSEEERQRASRLLADLGLATRPVVVMHPSSGSPAKNWDAEDFLKLARLAFASGWRVLWVEGEADAPVVRPLAAESGAPVVSGLPLWTLAAVLERASVYIGNDSGVSHLAAACGSPTVALFRVSSPKQWAPIGPRVRVVEWRASPDSVWAIARALSDPY